MTLIINYLTETHTRDKHIACWRTNESIILVYMLVKMRIIHMSRAEKLQILLNSTINAFRACRPF